MTHQPPRRPDRFDRDRDFDRGFDRGFDQGIDREYGRERRYGADDRADAHAGDHSERPLPQEIYTRRRVAAVAAILAVVALVVWALTAVARSGGGNDEPETPAPAPSTLVTTPTEPNPGESSETETTSGTSTATSDAAATEEPKPEDADKEEGAEPTDKDAAALAAKKTCELQDLQLTTELSKTAFSPEDSAEDRRFSVVIHNPTGGDCVIDTDENQLHFVAYSIDREGFQQIWSDTDCNKPMVAGSETFAAGESRRFTAAWSGLGSAPGQCDARQPAGAGAYAAVGFLGENGSDPATFNITG